MKKTQGSDNKVAPVSPIAGICRKIACSGSLNLFLLVRKTLVHVRDALHRDHTLGWGWGLRKRGGGDWNSSSIYRPLRSVDPCPRISDREESLPTWLSGTSPCSQHRMLDVDINFCQGRWGRTGNALRSLDPITLDPDSQTLSARFLAWYSGIELRSWTKLLSMQGLEWGFSVRGVRGSWTWWPVLWKMLRAKRIAQTFRNNTVRTQSIT